MDPNDWSGIEWFRVGDPLTEEWLDRIRALMSGYKLATDALEWIAEGDRYSEVADLRDRARETLALLKSSPR